MGRARRRRNASRTPNLADQSALRWGKPSGGGNPARDPNPATHQRSIKDRETCQLKMALAKLVVGSCCGSRAHMGFIGPDDLVDFVDRAGPPPITTRSGPLAWLSARLVVILVVSFNCYRVNWRDRILPEGMRTASVRRRTTTIGMLGHAPIRPRISTSRWALCGLAVVLGLPLPSPVRTAKETSRRPRRSRFLSPRFGRSSPTNAISAMGPPSRREPCGSIRGRHSRPAVSKGKWSCLATPNRA